MTTFVTVNEAAPAASRLGSASAPRRLPGLSEFREIWMDLIDYRFLLQQLTLRDIKVRYKQATMGFFWAVFMPAMIVVAGLLVRYAMAYFSGRPMDLSGVSGLVVKSIPWAFFVGAMNFATGSLVGNQALVTKIYFPREVLPVASILAQTFDTTIGALAMAILLAFLGVTVSAQIVWLPVLLALLFVFTMGVSMFLACANLFFRDVKYIVSVLLRFGIFFSPVFFEPVMFGPKGARLLMLNPISPYLEGLRLSVIEGHNLLQPLIVTASNGAEVLAWTPWYLVYGAVAAFLILVLGTLMFHRLEFVFAEYA